MVFYVLTTTGYQDLVAELGRTPSPIWLNEGVLAKEEVARLREAGIMVTVFSEHRDPEDLQAITKDIWTILEHHEGESVWVQYPPSA
jgi:hypothetical protein